MQGVHPAPLPARAYVWWTHTQVVLCAPLAFRRAYQKAARTYRRELAQAKAERSVLVQLFPGINDDAGQVRAERGRAARAGGT